MVELEAEASNGALPDYPPEPPVRKKEYIVLAEHEHWDYLKGSGPSAPPRVVRAPSMHPCKTGIGTALGAERAVVGFRRAR
jgi:hypothetical protein